MEGVEILNIFWVMPQWMLVLIATIGAICLIGLIASLVSEEEIGAIIFSVLALLMTIAAAAASIGQLAYVPQYEATISDEVNFTELNEKYKIIEQRGQIYVLEERI